MRELAPNAKVFAMIVNPKNPNTESISGDAVGGSLPWRADFSLQASSEHEFDAAFASLVEHRLAALIVNSDPYFYSKRDQLAVLAREMPCPRSTSSRFRRRAAG